jgi:Clp amino terminal domain, pathogenicity island component
MTENQPRLEQMIAMLNTQFEDDDDLQRLTEAVILGARLQELGDDLVTHFVGEARVSGASWADIGDAMGVTRQAAQKRFVGSRSGRGRAWSLFKRFGDRPRRVVREAVGVAQEMGDDRVGTEHLLLALTSDGEGLTARAIRDLGGDLTKVRDDAGQSRPRDASARRRHIRFDDDAKKTLELSLREAIKSERASIEEEHIVTAILRNEGCAGEVALRSNGIGRRDFEAWVEHNVA